MLEGQTKQAIVLLFLSHKIIDLDYEQHNFPVWVAKFPAGRHECGMEFLSNAFVTLLVTVDPPAIAPMFLALTVGMTAAERRQVAWRATLIATLALAFFAIAGQKILSLLGITLPAFRIAGGLLLFWIAFEMVFERRAERKSNVAQAAIDLDHIRNVAAFPLAIPLMAGPGAITATMLLAGQTKGDPALLALLIGIITTVCLMCWLVFLFAEVISKALGVTGNIVLSRLLGIILVALAVQFVVDGVKAAFSLP
jgi:multiple antibiotic resistance protein